MVDLEAQLALQGGLAVGLSPQVVRAEGRGRVRVGLGVPFGGVDPVGDSVEHVLSRLQHAVQAPAALRGGYLPRVPLRTRGGDVRVLWSAESGPMPCTRALMWICAILNVAVQC